MLKFWDSKPVLKILIPFACGIFLSAEYSVPMQYVLAAIIILGLFSAVAFWKKWQPLFLIFIFFVFLAMGAVQFYQHKARSNNNIAYFTDMPLTVAVQGMVGEPVESNSVEYIIVVNVDSLWVLDEVYSVSGKIKMSIPHDSSIFEYGDVLVSRGILRRPRNVRNPGEFDYQKYLSAQGIDALFLPDHSLVIEKNAGHPFLQHVLYPLRTYVTLLVHTHLDDRKAGMLIALLVGSRAALDESIKTTFAETGVFHVLAVSGLHVGFIMALLIGFFSFLRLPQSIRTVLVLLLLFLYALFTGLKPPVFRATIMAAVYLCGTLLNRKADALNSISVAAFILLFLNPENLFQPGFQLSFSAVIGIMLIYQKFYHLLHPLFRKWHERGNTIAIYFSSLLLVSAAAQLATLPFALWYFGKIAIVGLFANLFVVPLIAVILALAVIAICFSAIWFPAGGVLFQTIWLIQTVLLWIVNQIAALPWSYFTVPRPPIILLVAFVMLLLFLIFGQYRQKFWLFVLFLILLNVHVWKDALSPHYFLKITFLDVGQGDSILLQCPNGKIILVDTGDISENYCCAEQVIFPFLQRNGIDTIDELVLTHGHSDHIGGAVYLMHNMTVRHIVKPPLSFQSALGRNVDSLTQSLCIPVSHLQNGDSLLVDESLLMVCLHPHENFLQDVKAHKENLNNSSIVLYCFYAGRAFLLMGDAELAAEQRIAATYDSLVQSLVLKCGHHGSETACSETLLGVVKPQKAIISVGAFNRFGLPDASVLNTLRRRHIEVLRTDQRGAVQCVIYPDGDAEFTCLHSLD